jgi:hypothetical protein
MANIDNIGNLNRRLARENILYLGRGENGQHRGEGILEILRGFPIDDDDIEEQENQRVQIQEERKVADNLVL